MMFIVLLCFFCVCTNTTIASISSCLGLLFGCGKKKRPKIGLIENKNTSTAALEITNPLEMTITNHHEMTNFNLKNN